MYESKSLNASCCRSADAFGRTLFDDQEYRNSGIIMGTMKAFTGFGGRNGRQGFLEKRSAEKRKIIHGICRKRSGSSWIHMVMIGRFPPVVVPLKAHGKNELKSWLEGARR